MSKSQTQVALNITIAYTSIYGFVILITSIVCAFKVRQIRHNKKTSSHQLTSETTSNISNDDQKTEQTHSGDPNTDKNIDIKKKTNTQSDDKICDAFKEWFKLVKQKKNVYLSLIPHIFDQATDFGVIHQYYVLWQNKDDLGDANAMYFFYASLLVIILHRIASSIGIYKLTRKWSDFILQIFDLMMIKAIWVNYKLHKNDKANPQRFLEILEATFESGPQLLISSAYILKTSTSDSGKITTLMIVSVLFSLWSITSRVSTDDKSLFRFVRKTKRKLWTDHGFEYNKCPCLHWQYLFRVIIWRFFEITNRIFMCILIWVNLGGLALSIIFGCELMWLLVVSILQRTVDPMSSMMYLSPTITDTSAAAAYGFFAFWFYRLVSNIIYLILITIFAVVQFEAEQVEEFTTRNGITIQSSFGLFMLIYTWITAWIWPCAGLYIAVSNDVPTMSRDLRDLISNVQVDEVIELMEFGIKMTADDVIATSETESCLYRISYNIKRYGIFHVRELITINLFIILRNIVSVAPQSINEEHLLYPLELQCKKGGDLLHLAVALTMVGYKNHYSEYQDKSTEIVQQIIDDTNLDINFCNEDQQTALHCIGSAAFINRKFTVSDVENAKILLQNGMDKNRKDKNNQTILDILLQAKQEITQRDYCNNIDKLIQHLE